MSSFASLCLALALGIGCAAAPGARALGAGVALTMWSAGLVLFALLARGRGAGRGARALALCLAVFSAGGLLGAYRLDAAAQRGARLDARTDDRELDTALGVVRGPIEYRGSADGQKARFNVHLDAPERARVRVTVDAAQAPWPGDRVAATGLLRTPRGYRVPGRVPAEAILGARGAELGMYARGLEVVEPGAETSVWRWAARAQRALSQSIAGRGGSRAGNAVVRAMVTGDRSGLDRELDERYRDAGVAHVLAVSGLHLAVVALLLFGLVRRVTAALPGLAMRVRPDLLAALVALPAAAGYTLMTGARPSTMRALLVVVVMLVAAAWRRRARMLDALGVAALVLLVQEPAVLWDPGFQLSFAAVTTLVLVARPRSGPGVHGPEHESGGDGVGSLGTSLARAGRGLMRLVAGLVRASFFATLATAPLTALAFGNVAFSGLVGNLLAVPLTELVIVPLGLGGALVHQVWPGLGGPLLDLVIACAGWLDAALGQIAARAPAIRVFRPGALELLGAFALWLAAVAWARGAARRRVVALFAACGVALILGSYGYTTRVAPARHTTLDITFLDVGQGDAAVIELPGGGVWMIDSGGLPFVQDSVRDAAERRYLAEAPGRLAVARFLAERRIRRIDLLILSHPHPDHFAGLGAVAQEVSIGTVWLARQDEELPASLERILGELAAAGTRIEHPMLDLPYVVPGQVSLTVLAPRYLDRVATGDPVMGHNDNSLVVRLRAFGRDVLFTGDIEREAEELLVARYGRALGADIVKVPHHGSRTSSSPGLVSAVTPALAVISCGLGNRFGFPAPEVVDRWRAAGAAVLGTDRVGSITVRVAPHGAVSVHTFDPMPWPAPEPAPGPAPEAQW